MTYKIACEECGKVFASSRTVEQLVAAGDNDNLLCDSCFCIFVIGDDDDDYL